MFVYHRAVQMLDAEAQLSKEHLSQQKNSKERSGSISADNSVKGDQRDNSSKNNKQTSNSAPAVNGNSDKSKESTYKEKHSSAKEVHLNDKRKEEASNSTAVREDSKTVSSADNTGSISKILDVGSQKEDSKAEASSSDAPSSSTPLELANTEVVEGKSKKIVVKLVDIPSSLVGYLLARKPVSKFSAINSIQYSTQTIISKIIKSDKVAVDGKSGASTEKETATKTSAEETDATAATNSGAVKSSQRRRALSQDDEDSDVDSEDSEDQTEAQKDEPLPELEDDDADGDDDSAAFHDAVTDLPGESKEKINSESDEPVTFKVSGSYEINVDTAIDAINRVIKGERIKEVTDNLRITAKSLPRRPNGKKPIRKPTGNSDDATGAVKPRNHKRGDDGGAKKERTPRPDRDEGEKKNVKRGPPRAPKPSSG